MLHDGGCSPVSSMGSHKEVEDIASWGHSPMVSLPSIPDRVLSGISGRRCSGSTHAQSLGTVEHVYEHELLSVVPIV